LILKIVGILCILDSIALDVSQPLLVSCYRIYMYSIPFFTGEFDKLNFQLLGSKCSCDTRMRCLIMAGLSGCQGRINMDKVERPCTTRRRQLSYHFAGKGTYLFGRLNVLRCNLSLGNIE